MPIVKCNQCGKEFNRFISMIRVKNYCSKECKNLAQIKHNKIIIEHDYATIIINSKKYGEKIVFIDIEDIDKIKNYTWRIANKYFYICTHTQGDRKNRQKILMHRLIMGCPDDMIIDHINHNPWDNRKKNLRICNEQENNENKKMIKNRSGYRNIYWHKRDKMWQVSLKFKGKTKYAGAFENLEIAKEKAIELRNKYFTHHIEAFCVWGVVEKERGKN